MSEMKQVGKQDTQILLPKSDKQVESSRVLTIVGESSAGFSTSQELSSTHGVHHRCPTGSANDQSTKCRNTERRSEEAAKCRNANIDSVNEDKSVIIADAVWPSPLHAVCVKLLLSIGSTEFIFGPQLAWHYGGCMYYLVVAFLILLTSLPMHFLECIAGQYTAQGFAEFLPRLAPIFRGLGYAIIVDCMLIAVYYMQDGAWIAVYTYYSAHSVPHWKFCSPTHNSEACYSEELQQDCSRTNNYSIYFDFECMPADEFCKRHGFASSNGSHCVRERLARSTYSPRWLIDDQPRATNATSAPEADGDVQPIADVGQRKSSQRDFFYSYVRGDGLDNRPMLRSQRKRTFIVGYLAAWVLVLLPCFSLWLAAWLAVAAVVLSPIITLLILFRVMLFPGAWAGVRNFFYGRASAQYLLNARCWVDAISMTLWSVNIGMGLNPTLSSRNRVRHNALASSAVVVFSDVAFGFLNSLLLFVVRGTLEHRSDVVRRQLEALDSDSQALMFVAFTKVVDLMPQQRFWGVMYFGTMLAQTVGSVAMIVISTGLNLLDAVPSFQKRSFHVAAFVAFSPALLFGGLLVAAAAFEARWSFYQLVKLQWVVFNMMLATALGQKLSSPAFIAEIRDALGQDVGLLRRGFVCSWLVFTPVITVFQLLYILAVNSWPHVPVATFWLAVINVLAVLSPLAVLVVTTALVCSRTSVWALFATTDQFQPHRRARGELLRRPRRVRGAASGGSWRQRTVSGDSDVSRASAGRAAV